LQLEEEKLNLVPQSAMSKSKDLSSLALLQFNAHSIKGTHILQEPQILLASKPDPDKLMDCQTLLHMV
jgi:hypothetical protein